MNYKQRQRHEFAIRKGFRKPTGKILQKTENGIIYEMSDEFVIPYLNWRSAQRTTQNEINFTEYYKSLDEETRKKIKVTIGQCAS